MARRPTAASAARRVHAASLRVLPPPERQPAQRRARTSVTPEPATCWRPRLARRTTALHCKRKVFHRCSVPFIARMPISASAVRCALAASLRVLPPLERQPEQWRSFACHANVGCPIEATARTSHHGLAPKKRGLPPLQCPLMARRTITTSATRRARATSLRVLPPPERQPPQWRLVTCHVNAGCVLEATARTLHYGLAPKEKGLPPVQCPFIPRMPIAASAARRARAASLRVSPPLKR